MVMQIKLIVVVVAIRRCLANSFTQLYRNFCQEPNMPFPLCDLSPNIFEILRLCSRYSLTVLKSPNTVIGDPKIEINLVPRFSLVLAERPWLGLVTCLPESGRFSNKRFGGGADKGEICLCRALMESAAMKLCT